jgi:hypothetical protein
MNKITKTIGKLRGFVLRHARPEELKNVASWIDELQALTDVSFNWSEIEYLKHFLTLVKNRKPHEVIEWTQVDLLEKLTIMAEKLEQVVEETQSNKAAAQRHYCESKGLLQFGPYDGYCYRCGKDVYANMSVAEAGSTQITGCPHCFKSFVD